MVSQRAEGGGVPSKALVVLSEVMLISCGKSGKTAGFLNMAFSTTKTNFGVKIT